MAGTSLAHAFEPTKTSNPRRQSGIRAFKRTSTDDEQVEKTGATQRIEPDLAQSGIRSPRRFPRAVRRGPSPATNDNVDPWSFFFDGNATNLQGDVNIIVRTANNNFNHFALGASSRRQYDPKWRFRGA